MENKSENCETIYWSGLVWPSWKIKQTELSDVTARSCPQLAWLAKVLASSGRDKTTTLLVVTITTSTFPYTRQTKIQFIVLDSYMRVDKPSLEGDQLTFFCL